MSELEAALRTSQGNVDDQIAAVEDLRASGESGTTMSEAIAALTVSYCRHLNAVCDVLLPAVGPRGGLAWGCIDDSWDIERALRRLDKEMSRETWEEFAIAHRVLRRREQHVLERIAGRDALAPKFTAALDWAPTRPHVHAPHHGRLAHLARRLDAVGDHLREHGPTSAA